MPILGCGAELSKVMQVSDEDIAVIEESLADRLEMGESQASAQKNAVADAIAQLQAERDEIMQKVLEQIPVPKKPEPVAEKAPEPAPEVAVAEPVAESAEPVAERKNSVKESKPTDQTQTAAFKRWFGDSKVVDDQGKPLVVYHGTSANISAFRPSRSGWYGRGMYFTDDVTIADEYSMNGDEGQNIIPVYLRMEKPYLYSEPAYYERDPGDEANSDLIREILPREKAMRLIAKMRREDTGYLGRQLHDALRDMGYDGLIVESSSSPGAREFIVFEPTQIKSAIGNNGNFDGTNPDIRRSVAPRQQSLPLNQPNAVTWDDLGDSTVDAMLYQAQDDRIDLKRVQENIAKAGRQIREQFDARLAETLFPGRVARRTESFMDAEAKPLLESLAKNNVTLDELGDYMMARHAPERNAQIAKINPDFADGGAGSNSQGVLMTTQAANDYIANLPSAKRTMLELMARRVDAITKGTRDMLVAEGLEKAETVAAWEGAYKHYVPLFKDEAAETPGHPVGSGFSVKGGASKRATGSEKEATNIVAHVLMQREAAITRAEKNRVAMSLYGLALSNPNKGFWTTIKPSMDPTEIAREVQSMGVSVADAFAGMSPAPTIRTVDPITNTVVDRPNPVYKSLQNALVVKVNGEDRVILFNAQNDRALRMVESLKNQNRWGGGVDVALNSVGQVTRFMAAMLTQYNPAFGMVNAVRDIQGALVNLSSTPLAGKQMQVLGNVRNALVGIARDLRGDKNRTQWSDLWLQFQDDGGRTGIRDLLSDPYEKAARVEKDIARLQRAGKFTAGNAAHAVLDLLSDFNDSIENAVRLSAYKSGLDSGMSRAEAARLARELTVDFNRKGKTGRELGKLYAFLNASIQGTARTVATLKGPAGAKVIAGGFALGVLQAMMLAAAGLDDDDEVAEFIKARNLVIPTGGDRYVTIPLALGLHVLPNTGRVLTEMVMSGGKDLGEKSLNAIVEILTAFNPLGGGGDWKSGHGPLTMVAPTVLDPVIDLSMNRDFTGNRISKERNDFGGDVRPGYKMAKEGTRETPTGQAYTSISKAINGLTGGTDNEKGAVSPTPETLRYLATVVGGGVYRETEKVVNSSIMLARGEEVKARQVPLGSRFAGEVDPEMSAMGRFYKNNEKLSDMLARYKLAVKAGDTERAKEIQSDPRFAAAALNSKVQTGISKVNKMLNEEAVGTEQYRALEKQRLELMKQVNAAVKEAEAK